MIYGVGIDLVQIGRIQRCLDRYGQRFAKRVLSESEYLEFTACANQPRFLAKRFAAKEAFSKALGTGIAQGLSLRDISVNHDEAGRPFFRCQNQADRLLGRFRISASHLTLSDEADYAIAYVTLETETPVALV